MTFNGPLPGLPESAFGSLITFFSELGVLDAQDKAHNLPSEILHDHPTPPTTPHTPKPHTPKPQTATPTPVPTRQPTTDPPPR